MLILLSVLIVDSRLARAAERQCFFPNGQPEDNLVPCTSASVSSCCAVGDTCISNGLCKNGGDLNSGFYWRDGCTDSTWGDGCPQMCVNGGSFDLNAPNRNYLVRYCGSSGSINAIYCCATGPQDDCCASSSQVFTALQGSGYTVLQPAQSTTASSAVLPSSSSGTSVTSASSPFVLTAASATSSLSSTSTIASTTLPVGTSSATPVQHQSGTSGSLSTGARVGIGIGVALGVLAAAAASLFWLLKKRKPANILERNKLIVEPHQSPPVNYQAYSYSHDLGEDPNKVTSELPAGADVQELEVQQRPSEAPSYGAHERAYELSSLMTHRLNHRQ
ncbi:hypothetical protein LTR10_011241 [Elasticomyces elasticus]|nr:hypothetical protein LTR10_011241 [Elasticomyces elasticus]KAK4966343.1 hypothetical protein LTR42_011504 [Elasticomyces elasticus]